MISFAVLAAPDSWYAGDLQRAAAGRFALTVLPFSRVAAGLGHDLTFTSGDSDLAHYAAILVRTMPPGSLEQVVFRMDALGQLEAAGVLVVNPPRALEVAVDKYLTLTRLRAAGIPVPRTWVGQTAEDALAAWDRLGRDTVVKPLFGGEGRGMFRVSDPDLAWRAFTTLERSQAVIYLQEFVHHPGYDWRLFVLGNQVWGMQRSNDSDWRTNVSRGARTQPLPVTDELRDLALRSQQAVGTLVAGVDVLPDVDGQLRVIEVNAVPGWRGLARTIQVDIAARLLEFVAERSHAGEPPRFA